MGPLGIVHSRKHRCGYHNDHCSLTSLMPAMYHDETGKQIACPDMEAGLYIKSRAGNLVHVRCVLVSGASLSSCPSLDCEEVSCGSLLPRRRKILPS